jgi:UDP-GlcNAc:undecaprenyl-phosphate GlcNAc-1-phosphate transferase
VRVPYSLFLALATAAVVLALTPLAERLARRVGAMAKPGPRHVHREPTPQLGGLAMAAAVLGVAWLARWVPGPAGMLEPGPLIGFTLASIPLLALGWVDDTRGVVPVAKLVVQACAALVLAAFGYGVPLLTNPLGDSIEAGWLNLPLTVLWVLAVINAVNLIDGLDGLASGVVAIASAALWWAARQHSDLYVMLLASLLIGATLGFLRYNYPPARMFMGDTGSHFLGLALAALSLLENRKGTATVTLLVPLLALLVPMVDSVLAFARRAMSGRPVFQADSEHIHHRLLRLGLPPTTVTWILWGLCAGCGIVAVLLSQLPRAQATLGVVVLAGLLFAAFEWVERARPRG